MKNILGLFLFVSVCSLGYQAKALVEIKAGYGTLASGANVKDFQSSAPSGVPLLGLTLDGIVTVPVVGIGGGLRLEDLKIGYDANSIDVESKLTRTSLIVNYRLINTLLYLGPIVTYGLSHTNNISMEALGTKVNDIKSTSVSSYSIGLEAGAKLVGFQVGGELGYMDLRYKDAKDSIGGGTHDINMSGNYLKIFVGIGI